jgi:hypothetical protein
MPLPSFGVEFGADLGVDLDMDWGEASDPPVMTRKRLVKAGILLGLGLNLASCGGFVADHWPHWAGGLPDDVPPRPGAPGYAEFIAHGKANPDQANQEQSKPDPASPQQPAAAAAPSAPQQAPGVPHPAASAVPVQAAAPQDDRSQDSSVVNGGLY